MSAREDACGMLQVDEEVDLPPTTGTTVPNTPRDVLVAANGISEESPVAVSENEQAKQPAPTLLNALLQAVESLITRTLKLLILFSLLEMGFHASFHRTFSDVTQELERLNAALEEAITILTIAPEPVIPAPGTCDNPARRLLRNSDPAVCNVGTLLGADAIWPDTTYTVTYTPMTSAKDLTGTRNPSEITPVAWEQQEPAPYHAHVSQVTVPHGCSMVANVYCTAAKASDRDRWVEHGTMCR